jgi:23S rRNA (cytosine1962-C5)-methyltransferase
MLGDMSLSPRHSSVDSGLVDFGSDGGSAGFGGRRLEQLGGVLVDRPLVQADLPVRRRPKAWAEAVAVFDREADGKGRWTFRESLPDPWQVRVPLAAAADATITLEVRPAPSGQVGIFLEQVPQWQWLYEVTSPGTRMLSLFAHSGAASLALAAAGAEVVHVDASKQATALARRNAAASGLGEAAIRWICDDARAFVAREVRRGGRYDGVVLDPPSWGHGPKGQAFSIDRDLEPLLADLATLLEPSRAASPRGPLLLTCHSPGWHHRRLRDTLSQAFGLTDCASGRLECVDAAGRTLALGDYARWTPS